MIISLGTVLRKFTILQISILYFLDNKYRDMNRNNHIYDVDWENIDNRVNILILCRGNNITNSSIFLVMMALGCI